MFNHEGKVVSRNIGRVVLDLGTFPEWLAIHLASLPGITRVIPYN